MCCRGYISPEYAANGLFSVKSDVFSFGVMVLEIVSGKKNRGFTHQDHHDNLLGHVSSFSKREYSPILETLVTYNLILLIFVNGLGVETLQGRQGP